jgi:hypothetical protein
VKKREQDCDSQRKKARTRARADVRGEVWGKREKRERFFRLILPHSPSVLHWIYFDMSHCVLQSAVMGTSPKIKWGPGGGGGGGSSSRFPSF